MKPGAAAARPRWPYFGPPQKVLLFTALGMWVSAALPWFVLRLPDRFFTSPGSLLAVAWTSWGGLMSLAGAVARWRLLALGSAVAGGATAVALAGWQALRILQFCPWSDVFTFRCFPGPGVFLAVAAGTTAIWQGWRILRTPA